MRQDDPIYTPEMVENNGTDYFPDLCFVANLANCVEHINSYIEARLKRSNSTSTLNPKRKALYTAGNRLLTFIT
jgi:hypothetical protein